MACKERDEIVGKRFLMIEDSCFDDKSEFKAFKWICGVVRAVTDRDYKTCSNTQVLVEEDKRSWQVRRWIKLHSECAFFAVESALAWAPFPNSPENTACESPQTYLPALSFTALVDKTGTSEQKQRKPVQSLLDNRLHFTDQTNIKPYQDKQLVTGPLDESERQLDAVKAWKEAQDEQQLLVSTPSILVGYRVQVYRQEGTTRWYTAVIHSYNDKTNELEVTDDTVLEEHTEDPATVHIRLLGHGVVESILRGENSRVRPTRTRRSLENTSPAVNTPKQSVTRRGKSQSPCPVQRSSTPKNSKESSKSSAEKRRQKATPSDKTSEQSSSRVTTPQSVQSDDTLSTCSEESSTTENSKSSTGGPKRSLVVPLVDISPRKKKSRHQQQSETINNTDTSESVTTDNRTSESTKSNCSKSCNTKSQNSSEKNLKDNQASGSSNLKEDQAGKNCNEKSANERTTKKHERLKPPSRSSTPTNKPTKSQTGSKSSRDTPTSSHSGDQATSKQNLTPSKPLPACTKSCDTPSAKPQVPSQTVSKQQGDSNPKPQESTVLINDKNTPGKTDPNDSKTGLQTGVKGLKSKTNKSSEKASDIKPERSLNFGPHTKETHEPCNALSNKCTPDKSVTCSKTNACNSINTSTSNTLVQSELVHNKEDHSDKVQKHTQNSDKSLAPLTTQTIQGQSVDPSKVTSVDPKVNPIRTNSTLADSAKVNLHSLECCKANSNANLIVDSKDMHYKKYLLGDYQKKEGSGSGSSGQTSPIKADEADRSGSNLESQIELTQGINLNQSLTDQLARRNKESAGKQQSGLRPDDYRSWASVPETVSQHARTNGTQRIEEKAAVSVSANSVPKASVSQAATVNTLAKNTNSIANRDQGTTSSIVESQERARVQLATSSPSLHPSSTSQHPTPASKYPYPSSHGYEIKPPANARGMDSLAVQHDMKQGVGGAPPGDRSRGSGGGGSEDRKASPLLVDKNKRVVPYRDPELLKRDEVMHRFAALQSAAASANRPTPHSQSGSTASGLPPPPQLATTRPQGMIAGLPGYPSGSGLSLPLSLQHFTGGLDPASLSMLQQHAAAAQLHHLQLLQSQAAAAAHLVPYQVLQTRQLELLWQQKYPNIPVPPGWILHQYQDELMRDVGPLLGSRELLEQRREMAREHEERAERERAERDRAERERMERDRAERERAERERAERERAERDRQDRERREREERDRHEREAAQRREILHESKAAADAVEKHFQESLAKLASQQNQRARSQGIWTPGLGAVPNCMGSKLPTLHGQYPHMDQGRKLDEKPHGPAVSVQDLSHKPGNPLGAGGDMKSSKLPVEQHKPSLSTHPKLDFVPGFPASAAATFMAHMNALSSAAGVSVSSHVPQTSVPVASITAGASISAGTPAHTAATIKQEPNFSLLGYPNPATLPQMYISQDKLAAIKDEKPTIKTKQLDSKLCSPSGATHAIKTENKSSVIVENKMKEALGLLPANATGSISQGTARAPFPTVSHPSGGGDTKGAGLPVSGRVPVSSPGRVTSPLAQGAKNTPVTGLGGVGNNVTVSHAFTAMQQAYLAALSQANAALSPAFAQALQQQHALSTAVMQQNHSSVNSQHSNAPPVQSSADMSHNALSPNSQKRRAPPTTAKPPENAVQQKKPRVDGVLPNTNTPGAFIECFKTFVENTVTSAFYHDQSGHKPIPIPGQTLPNPAQIPTAGMGAKITAPVSVNALPGKPILTGAQIDSKVGVVEAIKAELKPPRVATPPGPAPSQALPTLTSGMQDAINRVANGTLDTDSDTLSAPSPPLGGTLPSKDAASCGARAPSAPRNLKKVILQRYSDQKVPNSSAPPAIVNENSNSSIPDASQPPKPGSEGKTPEGATNKSDTHKASPSPGPPAVAQSAVAKVTQVDKARASPAPSGGKNNAAWKQTGKSPFSAVVEDENATTSASECESTHDDTRPSKKGQKRKQESSKTGNEVAGGGAKKSKESGSGEGEQTTETKPKKAKQESQSSKEKKKKKGGKKGEEDDHSSHASTPNNTTGSNSAGSGSKPATPRPSKAVWDCERKLTERQEQLKAAASSGGNSMASAGSKKGKKGEGNATPEPVPDNPSLVLAKKPLNKEPVARLKKSGEPFLQDEACMELAPKLMKCRECKLTPTQMDKKQPNIFCRFYAFRRLKFSPKGVVTIAGFSEPSDADVDDIELWYPRKLPLNTPHQTADTDDQQQAGLSVEMARYLVENVGDRFCELVEQEKEAMMWMSPDNKIVWKRAVQGVREMCDVCDTTLFNMHWCCHKCGFVVCIDCYRNKTKKVGGNQDKHMRVEAGTVTNQKWLACSASRQQHEPDKLRITQIIPSDVLWALGAILHEVRDDWSIPSNCPCGHRSTVKPSSLLSSLPTPSSQQQQNGLTNHAPPALTNHSAGGGAKAKPMVNGVVEGKKSPGVGAGAADLGGMSMLSPLNLLAEAAVSRGSEGSQPPSGKNNKDGSDQNSNDSSRGGEGGSPSPSPATPGGGGGKAGGDKCSTLRDLLTRQGVGIKAPPPDGGKKPGKSISSNIDDVLLKLAGNKSGGLLADGERHAIRSVKFSHYVPRSGQQMQGRKSPIPRYTLAETSVLFPEVAHSWLDDGRLLRLHEPGCPTNINLFQQQWRRAQPVLVSNCHKRLQRQLWTPSAFGKEFGHQENDLINCSTLVPIIGHKMKVFWDGFEKMSNRLKDKSGTPLIVKLKDWPPTEDFSELMPTRFKDLMHALPLPEYTHRNGTFNLAARLPEFFVKPDLGPKLYNAYGSALHPHTGTTNLHLDVSDATNMMVYVGIPADDAENLEKAALSLLEEARVCENSLARVTKNGERPGALWHIFDPQDADKIREMLNKVAKESGEEVELDNDPIHDQSFYLDSELRERLLRDYDVQAYTIVQFLGDAVFIPAGAPHQVQNLHSCIKAAEDFVSPENINHCFFLTQEFRHLSDQHSNHEDKLQIKNMIYHAMKDAVAVLKHSNTSKQ